MSKSNLPEAGENLFQKVKRQCEEAQANGVKLIKFSIGQPSGPALLPAREAAAKAVMSTEESTHEYQDNGSPGVPNFAQRFIQCHVKNNLFEVHPGLIDFLPIPGIKPMLGVVIEAMGGWTGSRHVTIGTMTKPGYPTPADQCQMKKGVDHFHLPMDPKKNFLFDLAPTGEIIESLKLGQGDLLMLNFPHNPSGIVAKKEWLTNLCAICEERGIHIFNDAAYAILTNTNDSVTLTDIALDFPNLNWAEAFSASKAGNNTGWRVGAITGSPEFVGDIRRVKGNTDSGFSAPMADGVLDLFEDHRELIDDVREEYNSRISAFDSIVSSHGLRLAATPDAGFFLLYDAPEHAFGRDLKDAEEFNNLMINNTGIVGVPFGPWIRYAICANDPGAHEEALSEAFNKAELSY